MELIIIQTLAYFDLFDYPLTAYEIWRCLPVATDFLTIQNILRQSRPAIASRHGFFYLAGREPIITTRLQRYHASQKKFQRAQRLFKIYQHWPWLEGAYLANAIGAHNLRLGGDLDLFLITKPRRLWLTRFFLTAPLILAHQRPTEGQVTDKFCLSFFVSSDHLSLQTLTTGSRDLYFSYWLAHLRPLYNFPDLHQKFRHANQWLQTFLPNWPSPTENLSSTKFNQGWHWLDTCEQWFKQLQIAWMPQNLQKLINRGSEVVADSQVIKLHATDRRAYYQKIYETKLAELAASPK